MRDASTILSKAGLGHVLVSDGMTADVEAALRRVSESLNGVDSLTRESARVLAVEILKSGKIQGAARLVDAAIGRPEKPESGGQGRQIVLSDIELWNDPVDGAELLGELSSAISARIVAGETVADAVALWALHSHSHDAAAISPILTFVSPEKRCGKTTALAILQQITPRPLPAANVTPAAMFRAVERFQPTLLIDEADTFLIGRRADPELRGVINSGHRRSTAVLLRCVGDSHEVKTFGTWCPKAVALIGDPPDTIRDRSILISMRRKTAAETVQRLIDDDDELMRLCRMAARWTADRFDALKAADPKIPDGLDDRAADNWRPLLALADLADGDWPARSRRAAVDLSGIGAAEDVSIRVQLLRDVQIIVEGKERITSADLVAELAEFEESPWAEWKNGKPISPTQLARLLKPFGVKPKQIWIGRKERGYQIDDFSDAFSRYLGAETVEAVEPSTGAGFGPKTETVEEPQPTVSKSAGNADKQGVLPSLPDRRPVDGEEGEKTLGEEKL